MIFVTLGTNDKEFKRLLEQIDKDIESGKINDEVIVQSGFTKYESKNMQVFDLISSEKFEELIEKCDILITHGGVGSILTGITHNKKVIAVPRLEKYKEHVNDHQLQIIENFGKEKYILALKDLNGLSRMIEKAKTFKPKKFKSNTANFISMLEEYIDNL